MCSSSVLLEFLRVCQVLPDLPVVLPRSSSQRSRTVLVWLQFTEANWKYKTEPSDQACLGLRNRQCNFPRGKVMGGSSVLNYMIYTRGNRRDYDNWERLGNTGWGWNDVFRLGYPPASLARLASGLITDVVWTRVAPLLELSLTSPYMCMLQAIIWFVVDSTSVTSTLL